MTIQRCGWCSSDPLYIQYHDQEWGQPLYDESALFELLCLEGQQAGLAWITVLKKRQHYRLHFFQHSIDFIAQLSDADLDEKLHDAGLIRHWGKLCAIRTNAQAWRTLKQKNIDVVAWLWSFSNPSHSTRSVEQDQQLPTQTTESQALSKALKKAGFKFVGPTICYAFMQASGMVNDHENDCSFKKISNSISMS